MAEWNVSLTFQSEISSGQNWYSRDSLHAKTELTVIYPKRYLPQSSIAIVYHFALYFKCKFATHKQDTNQFLQKEIQMCLNLDTIFM